MKVFPVDLAARPTFSDDWGQPRSGGRSHEGTDIFAARGTPVLAVAKGRAVADSRELGGLVVYLAEPDGTRYYYAHLDSYAGDFPRNVETGEILGFVGNTGNARTTAPHLHFEWRPQGGSKVNPYPVLASLAKPTSARRPVASAGFGLGVLALLWLWSRNA